MVRIAALMLCLASLAAGLAVRADPEQTVAATSTAVTPASPQDSARREQASRSYFTDLPLVTGNGEQVRFYSDVLKDRIVVINFVFTHCQDACPLMTQKLRTAREMLDEGMRSKVYFVSISIDPERDTPAQLKAFAEKHKVDDANWVFLTGDRTNIEQIVKKLGQYTQDVEDHSTLVLAGNVRTQHWMKIPPMVPAWGIAEKLKLLVQDS